MFEQCVQFLKRNLSKEFYAVLKKPFGFIRMVVFRLQMILVDRRHEKAICEIQKKKVINVAFFALLDSVWKYEEVYRLMEKDSRFNPVVFVCPVVSMGHDYMIENMDKVYDFYKKQSYNVIKTYEAKSNTYLNIKSQYNPDIIFYTNPYKGLIDDRYYIDKFKTDITCYVPYAIMSTANRMFYDLGFHNKLWKVFCETTMHYDVGARIQKRQGKNYFHSGYPGLDKLFEGVSQKDPWKIKNKKIKRVIWAPHHSIGFFTKVSNFLEYYDVFLEVAEKYKKKLQIAFKPHPLLRYVLYQRDDWGKDKTDEYYKKWEELENGQFEDSDYIDLFLESDALIHDSGSFISEYLATRKPSLFMISSKANMDEWSEYGAKALSVHYKSNNKADLFKFINDVVLDGQDHKKEKRNKFVNEILLPSNGKSASENILNHLLEEVYNFH